MKQITSKDVGKLPHNLQVRFILCCTDQVKDKWEKFPECVEAVRVTELWLEGKASDQECIEAAYAADLAYGDAADTAESYAIYTAGAAAHGAARDVSAANYAANASAYAANVAGKTKAREVQWDYYSELLHLDENAEKALLGEGV